MSVLVSIFVTKHASTLDVGKKHACSDKQAIENEQFHHHPTLSQKRIEILALAWRIKQNEILLVENGSEIGENFNDSKQLNQDIVFVTFDILT